MAEEESNFILILFLTGKIQKYDFILYFSSIFFFQKTTKSHKDWKRRHSSERWCQQLSTNTNGEQKGWINIVIFSLPNQRDLLRCEFNEQENNKFFQMQPEN